MCKNLHLKADFILSHSQSSLWKGVINRTNLRLKKRNLRENKSNLCECVSKVFYGFMMGNNGYTWSGACPGSMWSFFPIGFHVETPLQIISSTKAIRLQLLNLFVGALLGVYVYTACFYFPRRLYGRRIAISKTHKINAFVFVWAMITLKTEWPEIFLETAVTLNLPPFIASNFQLPVFQWRSLFSLSNVLAKQLLFCYFEWLSSWLLCCWYTLTHIHHHQRFFWKC